MFFTEEKIEKQLKEIHAAIHRGECDLMQFKYAEWASEDAPPHAGSGVEQPGFDDRNWQDFRVGQTWGGYDRVAWFRTWVEVPPEWRAQKLALRLLVGPRDGGGSTAESLVYINGSPLQAVDVWHEEVWLPGEVVQQGQFLLALRAWSGVLDVPEHRRFKLAQLVWIDEATERFYFLADTVLKAVKVLDENDLRRIQMLRALNDAFHLIDFLKPKSPAFYQSMQAAYAQLRRQIDALEAVKEIKPTVWGIGHAHIDMAWLWRLCHTREKAVRTFTTALHLMRQYPEYRFMHSSPQLYRFLKQDQPEIFERVKEKIASGEWEVTGGMWVEADTNLTSGESLVRQFLLGKRYIREEFGVEMNTLWLPDVFGYSAALPQIVRKSGLKYFLTSKISWSQFNRFPYDTFRWRGIDGTELLTHFVTTPENSTWFYTYNGQVLPEEVKGIWDNYRQKDANTDLLMLYGWGDGGGGPTREMLESARAMRNLPGIPEVKLCKAEEYFARLADTVADQPLPVWDGELYLEYHRGTYTSQAEIKRLNRQAEILYHNAEWLSALAEIQTGSFEYPREKLREGWEQILLHQFHDILPGSSIADVYADSRQAYAGVFAKGEQVVSEAQGAVAAHLGLPAGSLLVFNPLAWRRQGLVEVPVTEGLEAAAKAGSLSLPVQFIEEDGERRALLEVGEVPSLGYQCLPAQTVQPQQMAELAGVLKRAFEQAEIRAKTGGGGAAPIPVADAPTDLILPARDVLPVDEARQAFSYPSLEAAGLKVDSDCDMTVSPHLLENGYYRVELNAEGQITRLWDKHARREVLTAGQRGNVFQAFEDKPMRFDAWDIDIYYQEKGQEVKQLEEAVVEEVGPLRGVLRLRWRFADSTITQRLTLYRHSRRIDFRTEVDWHEHQVLLKVAFPVDVRATRATYDIQFGSLERPTHWNTSWDWARFESVGHKWVDLSEGNYGVSLLNDCKYGHDIHDNVMRLTLIKSGISPDANADQGRHVFTYSLLPHSGDWRQGRVVEEAYDLNLPLLPYMVSGNEAGRIQVSSDGSPPPAYEFAAVDAGHVILETVKKAEDGDVWIVRLYECQQSHNAAVTLSFGQPVRRAVECNLVEEGEQPVDYQDSRLTFPIGPFEIKTFKVWF